MPPPPKKARIILKNVAVDRKKIDLREVDENHPVKPKATRPPPGGPKEVPPEIQKNLIIISIDGQSI